MARITSIEPGSVVTSGVVNLRRFEGRIEEILVVAQLLDSRVTLIETGEQVTIHDVGMSQERNSEWNVSRLFVRKAGAGFGRRGATLTVPWNEVSDLFSQSPQQPVDALLASIETMRPADLANLLQELPLGEVVTRDYLRGEIRDLLEEFKEIQQTKTKGDSETS
jgi:hypothetical protein